MPIVQDAFDRLAARTLDATMSAVQYQESRRFFFAGAFWMLAEFEQQGNRRDDEDGENMMAYLEAIREECLQFGRLVATGKA